MNETKFFKQKSPAIVESQDDSNFHDIGHRTSKKYEAEYLP